MITERGGLLSRNPETERYRLGVDLIGMAAQVVSFMDVRQVARPFLRQLAGTCILSKSRGGPLRSPRWAGARPALTPSY